MTPASPAAHGPLVWDKPVREFPDLIHLAPPACHLDDSLLSVVAALSQDLSARCVYVLDEADHLMGGISERLLDKDLLTLALPQELWSSVQELDTRELVRLSRGGARTARDLMARVHAITAATSLKEAIATMTRSGESVLALVDDEHRLLGYLSLFEILADLARRR